MAVGLLMCMAGLAHADSLRPEIATPLAAAEHYLSGHEYGPAMRAVDAASAVGGKSAYESLTIDQVRAAIDSARGNYAAAGADYAALIASGGLSAGQVNEMAQAEASSDYQAHDYAGAIATIKAYLAGDPNYRPVLLQSYEQLGQCGQMSQMLAAQGSAPSENDLQMAAYCDAKSKNTTGYINDMTALVRNYPSPTYWSDLLTQMQAQPEFNDRLALDFARLKITVSEKLAEPDYMEMTQVALQAGLANEAQKLMDQGYASHVLGSGPDADRQTRLKTLVAARLAAGNASRTKDIATAQTGNDQESLLMIGLNQVDGGDVSGLGLMESAIRSGLLTQPGQAELELGIAYREAGKTAKAHAMWNAVQGGGGPVQLAKLWSYTH